MPSASRKARVREAVAARGWPVIGEAEWNLLSAEIPDLTPADLKYAGIPVEAPWSGVAQKSLADLDASLRLFAQIYADRPELRRFCRTQVIRAKDRARMASRNPRASEAKRAEKGEMIEWMLVWLGDPAMFPGWAAIRKNRLTSGA